MAKKITNIIKLNIPAGKGTPSPPVGPALGQAGINMMEFLKRYNEQTQEKMGFVLPVTITVYEDKSYAFIVKQPLTTDLIKREIGLDRGSQKPGRERAGTINRDQLRAVAKLKMVDYNTNDEEMAMRIVAGSARSMGLDVDWDN
ncbi:MAG: 50S ribosomal protein L11 [Armatimonadota bacterium]|jgi:large subunit ribosomal protein L11|nr:50S ribosomal protein L11 [Fimbriimonadaceae bacterium]MCZ8138839.1 50S ribosomal protein L11 [Fimbriimonadaceae bacterium]